MRRRSTPRLRQVGLLLSAWLVATNAFADARQEAEQQFAAGVSLQKVEDFDAAATAYQASVALMPTKSALFNLANCLKAIHRYAEALDALERLEDEFGGELDPSMAAAVESLQAKLRPLTATLRVNVSPTGEPTTAESTPAIYVDGKRIDGATGERLSIGTHELRVERPGHVTEVREVTLHSGEEAVVDVVLQPAAPPPLAAIKPSPQPPPPRPARPPTPTEPTDEGVPSGVWLATGAGSVLLLGAAVTGVWALSLDADLNDYCVDGHCGSGKKSEISRLETLALTTDVLAGVGLGLCVGGLTALLLQPDSEPAHAERTARTLRVDAGLGFVQVTGEF